MILDTIQTTLAELSSAQRKLAQFVLEKPAEAAFLSSHDLAARTNASPSTVVRLARSLGYAGFPEFQAALQELLIERLKATTRLFSTLTDRTGSELLANCLRADIAALEHGIETISPDAFDTVADLLAEARRIYLVGLGIAPAVVHALAFRLRRSRLDVHIVTEGGSQVVESLFSVEEGDVVIAVAFKRIRPELLAAVKFAHSRKATLVAFAEDPLSRHALAADHVILARRGPADTLNSLAVPIAIANALGLAVSQRRPGEATLAYRWVDDLKAATESGDGRSLAELEFGKEVNQSRGDN